MDLATCRRPECGGSPEARVVDGTCSGGLGGIRRRGGLGGIRGFFLLFVVGGGKGAPVELATSQESECRTVAPGPRSGRVLCA
jgi:hypothetical protein